MNARSHTGLLVYSCYPAAIATRSFRRIDKEIRDEQLPILPEGLVQRAAFRDIFDFANTLEELTEDKTSGLEQARQNAESTQSLGQEPLEITNALQNGRRRMTDSRVHRRSTGSDAEQSASPAWKGKTGFQLPPDASFEKQRLSDA